MHISEGVLSAPVLAGGAALTVAGTAIGLKRIDYQRLPMVAILSAAFFIASLIHVPIGPSSVHLLLNGLLGIILGWAAFPAILLGLVLQAVLFQYGGLIVLGVNTFNAAAPAVACHYLFARPIKSGAKKSAVVFSFLAGSLSVAVTSIFTAASLSFSGEIFTQASYAILIGHIPVMLIEGLITALTITFLKQVRPVMLGPTYKSSVT